MEEKLIEAVRIRQVLYDTSHVDYMRAKLKTETWVEIAKEIGMKSGSEAKALWEKLRHSLRDAIRRQQKCFKSGAGAETIKEWKFQKQMGFLQPYMANKSREGNLRQDGETEILTQDFEINVEAAEVDKEHSQQMNIEEQPENVEDESQPKALSETVPTMLSAKRTSIATPKSVKKIKNDNVTKLFKETIEKHEERSKARNEERKNLVQQLQLTHNDPLFNFFLAMYQSTKRMPSSYQHMIKNRLFNEVSQAEAMLLGISPAVQQQPSLDQQQPYYQTLHSLPAATPSNSRASTATSFYSEQSPLSPFDIRPEKNDYSTSSSGNELMNFITTFAEK
ncbi:uncharacterized protein LOC123681206 [Harmonia axyridis]|uniref:uncharacterized protein LOC123681206 n=1 Tax=Harmonia axyridis TaxID=115357 RepID=UPI001E276E25|nr:uncharacterized protein LOC123681206 [Harmonia axyridis]